jgi:predicted PurR-regulated permease PerM
MDLAAERRGWARWRDVLPYAAAIVIGIAVPALVYLLARPLALLTLAVTFAAALSPATDRLERRMPRVVAVVLLYTTLLASVVWLVWLILPTLTYETQDFVARAPTLLERARQWLGRWFPGDVVPIETDLLHTLRGFQDTLMRLPMHAVSVLFDTLVVVFLSLYLLISGPHMKRRAVALVPAAHRSRVNRLLSRVGRSMGGYVRGALISGLCVGVVTWVALTLVGLEFRRPLAVAAALGEFVPYVGPLLAAVPAILVASGDSLMRALIVGGIYLGLQQFESHVITPNVMKTQTDVPPALVNLALACGFSVGGLLGALTAIPLFAALRVLGCAVLPVLRLRARRKPVA